MKKTNLLLTALALIVLIGCDVKEKIDEVTTPTEAAEALQEFIMVNQQFQDASNSSDEAVLEGELSLQPGTKSTQEGPSITVDPANLTEFPKTYTVDFGEGTVGYDGITRSGKLIIISDSWFVAPNSTHTTTYDNFYQNGHKIEGNKVSKNLGKNEEGKFVYSVIITDGKITTADGLVIYYEQDSERTYYAGDDTPLNIWDDEYLFDGTQQGVSSKDVDYSLEITESLHFVMETKEVKAGILNVTLGSISGIEIDYAAQTISIGGISYPFQN